MAYAQWVIVHTRTRSNTLLLTLLSLAVATGCDSASDEGAQSAAKAEGKDKQPAKATVVAKTAKPTGPAPSLSKKLSHYIRCTNRLSPRVNRSATRYFGWAKRNVKKPPTRKTRPRGFYDIAAFAVKRCHESINKAPAKPEAPQLTKYGAAYLAAVDTLVPVVNEAYKYFSKSGYRLDKMKSAARLHAKLVPLFTAYEDAERALRHHIGVLSDKLQVKRLAELKAKGENFAYHRALTLHVAKKLVRIVAPLKTPKKLAVKAFDPINAEFVGALAKLKEQAKTVKTRPGSNLANFIKEVELYAEQLKWTRARAGGKLKYSSTERHHLRNGHGKQVKGHPAAATKQYNTMIAAANRRY